ncbi:hypothetical protein K488DRAFT_90397 [Vararia minispora EC-137]|uniref:Uncharacterized protein n=1 Tax=Vararia minispora EC-137 TaxID=1314806 RepID=A0ACB8Q7Q8_9AGAM|nr:hypothetical protein K488DRAFT_90397 [Vararia minispora EC-137]
MPSRLPACPELARLPRNGNRPAHVNFIRTTPGAAIGLLFRNVGQKREDMLDPSHPAANIPFSQRVTAAPSWKHAVLDVRAFPKAWLKRPDAPFPDPPYHYRPFPAPPRDQDARAVDMSLCTVFWNKTMHPSKFVRYPIKRRIKAAIELVVARGARVDRVEPAIEPNTKRKVFLAFDDADADADRWIKPDWTYVFMPKTEMFHLSTNEMVGLVRDALATINKYATVLDANGWRLRQQGQKHDQKPRGRGKWQSTGPSKEGDRR